MTKCGICIWNENCVKECEGCSMFDCILDMEESCEYNSYKEEYIEYLEKFYED